MSYSEYRKTFGHCERSEANSSKPFVLLQISLSYSQHTNRFHGVCFATLAMTAAASSPYQCIFASMTYPIDSINDLIRNRRSTFPKQYDPNVEVDEAIVRQVVENATWAPSHGNIQPWRFVVFSGAGREKLAQFQAETYKNESGENFKQPTYDGLLANPLKASHVIALCLKRDPNKKFPEIEEISAVACAVQNMYLTVTAYGLGGYWTTGGVTYKPSAKSFFGLGEDDKLMGFFYIGAIAVASPAKDRAPIDEKVEWVR
jgi:nitroreductase